ALQFLGDQLYYWTGPNNLTSVQWPANCPKRISNILNRSIQPHLVFDEDNYYYNLTIDLATGTPNCSQRSMLKIDAQTITTMMAVDAPMSKFGKDPTDFHATLVINWYSIGKICWYHMPLDEPKMQCKLNE